MAAKYCTTSDESQSERIEKSFLHRWTVHNFCCSDIEKGEVLPSTTFIFNLSTDLEFIGELSLEGRYCSLRECKLVLRCLTQEKWQVHVKLWISGEVLRQKSLNQDNNFTMIYLSDIFTSRCLLTDNIMCEVSLIEYVDTPKLASPAQKRIRSSHDLYEIFKTKIFSDVTLEVAGHELLAPKCVLASRSEVFDAMFENTSEESDMNKFTLPPMHLDVFEEMLRYIYTGELGNIDKMVARLFIASDFYGLKILKIICENLLADDISIESAAETLITAHLFKAKKLESEAMKFIEGNIQAVSNTKGWRNIIKNYCYLLPDIFLQTN